MNRRDAEDAEKKFLGWEGGRGGLAVPELLEKTRGTAGAREWLLSTTGRPPKSL
jgi:hypothetical protein